MKIKQNKPSDSQNPFSLSIGDLMSALLLLFILLLFGTLLNLNNAQQKVETSQAKLESIPKNYENTCLAIYNDLDSVFSEDLSHWGAEIDSTTLSIRFLKENVMFDNDATELKDEFKIILDSFFPRYLKIIQKYNTHITEIRIEGHTSSTGEYFHNMELSQNRARNVLKYCSDIPQCKEYHDLMIQTITANGYSYSRTIKINGIEDETRSRRVEFRIITDSEHQIQELLKAIQ